MAMNDPEVASTEERPRYWRAALARLRKPVVVVAAIGTVLGGFAGYITMYRTVTGTTASTPPAPQLVATTTDPISILVLPLANQTGDPAKAYMAEALTTAITGDLSRIQDAVIVPVATAISLQKRELTIQQLGTEAHVRFVLQGGVGVSGERLRINAQLSDTNSGRQLWSQTFDAPLLDAFALQDDLTARIRASVGPQMVLLAAREARNRDDKPQVADLVLRLRALEFQPPSAAVLRESEDLARKALAIEPGNLRARQTLATSQWIMASNFSTALGLNEASQRVLLGQAEVEADRVLSIEPDNVSMLLIVAALAEYRDDKSGARKIYERALEVDPRNAAVYNNFGGLLRRMGQHEVARQLLLRATQIPSYLPPANTFLNLAVTSLELGADDEAVDWAQRAIVVNPDGIGARAVLALAYAIKGDERAAHATAAELLRRHPSFQLPLPAGGTPWPGREVAYRDFVEKKFRPAAKVAGLTVEH